MNGFENFQLSAWAVDGLTLRVIKPLAETAKVIRSKAVVQAGACAVAMGMAFLPGGSSAANVVIPAHQVARPLPDQAPAQAEIDPSNWKLIIGRMRAMPLAAEPDVDDPAPFI